MGMLSCLPRTCDYMYIAIVGLTSVFPTGHKGYTLVVYPGLVNMCKCKVSRLPLGCCLMSVFPTGHKGYTLVVYPGLVIICTLLLSV